jgi:hypothetical protein
MWTTLPFITARETLSQSVVGFMALQTVHLGGRRRMDFRSSKMKPNVYI